MIDSIETFMNYIYKHSTLRNIIFYIFVSCVIFFSFIFMLLIFNVKIVGFSSFFQFETYWFLMQKYKDMIAIFIIVEQIGLISLILWQDRCLKSNKIQLNEIHIEAIAPIWTKHNTKDYKIDTQKTTFDTQQSIANINESLLSVANFYEQQSKIFINQAVLPYIKKMSSGHLKAIIRLINILEQNKDCPSVVAFAKTEPNVLYQDREFVSFEKKTRFDIYAQISVYKHSLNVALQIVELVKAQNVNKKDLLGKAIVAALAHDVGKINKYEMLKFGENGKKVNFKEFQSQPHQNISSMILYDGFVDCPDLKEIAEAVQRHHSGAIGKEELLLKILIDADKMTRDKELDSYKKGENICDLNPISLKKANLKQEQKEIATLNKQQSLASTAEKEVNLQEQIQELSQNEFFKESFEIEFASIFNANRTEISLLLVCFEQELKEKKYKEFEKILEKELQQENIQAFKQEQGFWLIFLQKDRTKVFNLAYDIMQRIIKSEFKTCKIGFVLSKEANNAEDMKQNAILAQLEAKANGIIDFKDIKNKSENLEKFSLKDDEDTLNECKQESTSTQPTQNEAKNEFLDDEFLEAFEKFEDTSKDLKAIALAKEEIFDIQSIEKAFLEQLKMQINTMRNFTIASISYKKFVLFNKKALLQTLKELLKNDDKLEQKLNYLIRFYRKNEDENKRIIWFVSVDSGYYESLYYLKIDKDEIQKFFCVPFEAKKAFGLSVKDLENSKRQSEFASYKILEHNIF